MRTEAELEWWRALQTSHDDLAGLVEEILVRPAWHADRQHAA